MANGLYLYRKTYINSHLAEFISVLQTTPQSDLQWREVAD